MLARTILAVFRVIEQSTTHAKQLQPALGNTWCHRGSACVATISRIERNQSRRECVDSSRGPRTDSAWLPHSTNFLDHEAPD
ncbi:hypothetical protein [Brevibacterium atlanticum]|uniref:hypothetical protein n=1 Tax=Brevibacterium atlanticum TaxID=2697563 RepID=UPI0014239E1B|nr:hypothetical protein [Brevibacterium atlanticum]